MRCREGGRSSQEEWRRKAASSYLPRLFWYWVAKLAAPRKKWRIVVLDEYGGGTNGAFIEWGEMGSEHEFRWKVAFRSWHENLNIYPIYISKVEEDTGGVLHIVKTSSIVCLARKEKKIRIPFCKGTILKTWTWLVAVGDSSSCSPRGSNPYYYDLSTN